MQTLRMVLLGIGIVLYVIAKFVFAKKNKEKLRLTILAIVFMLLAMATYLFDFFGTAIDDSGVV